MFLNNKNIIFKIRRSKVTDYAALNAAYNYTEIVYIGNYTYYFEVYHVGVGFSGSAVSA